MGQCSFKHEDEVEGLDGSSPMGRKHDMFWLIVICNKNNFHFHHVIGRGGFGQVWRVELKKTKKIYAMKEMSKIRIINKQSVNSVINERKLLSKLQHPFLVNINYAFQDTSHLYLISDLLTGGDLRFHIGKKRRFNEEQTKFMIGCMLLGLEYMHNENVIHRDIKPENIVMEETGYLRITDLGIAKILRPENSGDTSGTPGYMAPEVMCRQNHGVAVDFFAIGVIGYEFMMGRRPYVGRTRKEIRDMIFSKQVQIKRHELPQGWSLEAADFINKLLQRKPTNRLGLNGATELKGHVWLRDFDWQAMLEKRMPAPYKPEKNAENFDKAQANNVAAWKEDYSPEQLYENSMLLKRKSIQNLFDGYYFDPSMNEEALEQIKPNKMPQNIMKPSQQTTDFAATIGAGQSTQAISQADLQLPNNKAIQPPQTVKNTKRNFLFQPPNQQGSKLNDTMGESQKNYNVNQTAQIIQNNSLMNESLKASQFDQSMNFVSPLSPNAANQTANLTKWAQLEEQNQRLNQSSKMVNTGAAAAPSKGDRMNLSNFNNVPLNQSANGQSSGGQQKRIIGYNQRQQQPVIQQQISDNSNILSDDDKLSRTQPIPSQKDGLKGPNSTKNKFPFFNFSNKQ